MRRTRCIRRRIPTYRAATTHPSTTTANPWPGSRYAYPFYFRTHIGSQTDVVIFSYLFIYRRKPRLPRHMPTSPPTTPASTPASTGLEVT